MTKHLDPDEPIFRGSTIAPHGRRQRTAKPGRVCSAAGCATVLSVYNHEDRCWRHTPLRAYHVRGRRSGGRAA